MKDFFYGDKVGVITDQGVTYGIAGDLALPQNGARVNVLTSEGEGIIVHQINVYATWQGYYTIDDATKLTKLLTRDGFPRYAARLLALDKHQSGYNVIVFLRSLYSIRDQNISQALKDALEAFMDWANHGFATGRNDDDLQD